MNFSLGMTNKMSHAASGISKRSQGRNPIGNMRLLSGTRRVPLVLTLSQAGKIVRRIDVHSRFRQVERVDDLIRIAQQ